LNIDDDMPASIPKILHSVVFFRNGIPEKQHLLLEKQKTFAGLDGWHHVTWTVEDVEKLINEVYPNFVDIFTEYNKSYRYSSILHADAIRYFILHHIGGVYMDTDMFACRSLGEIFGGQDTGASVSLSFVQPPTGQILNTGMASPPGHKLWLTVFDTLRDMLEVGNIHPLSHTGPNLLGQAVAKYNEQNCMGMPNIWKGEEITGGIPSECSWISYGDVRLGSMCVFHGDQHIGPIWHLGEGSWFSSEKSGTDRCTQLAADLSA
jgi:mannosyltransferase OCH1-like enzyme